jgi:hypothetical protein
MTNEEKAIVLKLGQSLFWMSAMSAYVLKTEGRLKPRPHAPPYIPTDEDKVEAWEFLGKAHQQAVDIFLHDQAATKLLKECGMDLDHDPFQ